MAISGCLPALLTLAITLLGRLVLLQVTDGGQGAMFLKEQGALRTVRTAEIRYIAGSSQIATARRLR